MEKDSEERLERMRKKEMEEIELEGRNSKRNGRKEISKGN